MSYTRLWKFVNDEWGNRRGRGLVVIKYYHTSPACLVLMRAELAVMRHNAARWRWAVITDYGDVFVEPCLVAREGEVRVFLHNTWWLLYLDIWYLLYSISMQSCGDYLDSFHGCIRICLLDSGHLVSHVSLCHTAPVLWVMFEKAADCSYSVWHWHCAGDFTVTIVTVQSWRKVRRGKWLK